MAALPRMLEHDRTRTGCSVEQAARRLGISVREYRELEVVARSPSFDGWKAEPPAKTAQGRSRRR